MGEELREVAQAHAVLSGIDDALSIALGRLAPRATVAVVVWKALGPDGMKAQGLLAFDADGEQLEPLLATAMLQEAAQILVQHVRGAKS